MKTLSDFYTARNKGKVRGHREMGIDELGISSDHWDRNKDKPIRKLGLMYGLALSAIINEKTPFTRYGGTKIEQWAFAAVAAGLPPYWGDGK